MKNLLFMSVIMLGLLMFGCTGQNQDMQNNDGGNQQDATTTQTNDVSTSTDYSGDSQEIECVAGMTWNTQSEGYSMAGTIVGVENYKGRQACHVTAEIDGGYGNFDIYIDMADENASCVVMDIGGQTTETCTNWN